ncbi:DUF2971 domain-containing protein [Dyella lipolytica]|uniref:DUF2971 domain-containing protein n=1 Tax=Dyella lipolytica TaxID=1867835 RepID=A0ABW8IYK9_9GAMM|nr:hypothetical protein [Dyella lipolytica]GLQ45678.1 DUF2971 domain-containing protein [Dyella lipolytica]
MNAQHPTFNPPADEDVKIWRYMDFTKLISLFDSEALFLSRADKLGDPFEGSFPLANVLARAFVPAQVPEEFKANFQEAMAKKAITHKRVSRCVAVNCWHMNDHESAAMWKLYLKSDEGIAIRSSYRRLRDAIQHEGPVYVGCVNYIDYQQEWFPEANLLNPFVYKRKSFEHERELRVVLPVFSAASPGREYFEVPTIDHGINVKVDLQVLIESVYIAPGTAKWFHDLVSSAITRYGHTFRIVQSELSQEPIW